MGWLPQDMDKADQVKQLREMYQVCSNQLQVLPLAMVTLPKYLVNVPPFMAWGQLLVDRHNSLGYCRWDKLLSALFRSYWSPGMYIEVTNCIQHCLACQWDKPLALPQEELC